MPTLYLLRHAKAASAKPAQSDEDRPLTGRGRAQALSVGVRLAPRAPQVVRYSPALRTSQTYELLSKELDSPPQDVAAHPGLYSAAVATVLAMLATFEPTVQRALVVGHEPTMSATAHFLAGAGSDPAATAQAEAGIPTASLAVLEIAAWRGPWQRGAACLLAIERADQ